MLRLLPVLQPNTIFYKEEGGKQNNLLFRFHLVGDVTEELNKRAQQNNGLIPLNCSAVFEDGELCPPGILNIVGCTETESPSAPYLNLKTRMGGVRYRFTTVSKNLGGKSLCLVVSLANCPEVDDVTTNPTLCLSKRKKREQRLMEQFKERAEMEEKLRLLEQDLQPLVSVETEDKVLPPVHTLVLPSTEVVIRPRPRRISRDSTTGIDEGLEKKKEKEEEEEEGGGGVGGWKTPPLIKKRRGRKRLKSTMTNDVTSSGSVERLKKSSKMQQTIDDLTRRVKLAEDLLSSQAKVINELKTTLNLYLSSPLRRAGSIGFFPEREDNRSGISLASPKIPEREESVVSLGMSPKTNVRNNQASPFEDVYGRQPSSFYSPSRQNSAPLLAFQRDVSTASGMFDIRNLAHYNKLLTSSGE